MSEKRAAMDSCGNDAKRAKGVCDVKCIDTIRVLGADIVQKANSGHPGAPMGCAPIAHLLFGSFMNYSPANPKWHNRDRFVLSNGHSCALLYTMLHLSGYDLSMDDLKNFRQLNSLTPGHPENFLTPGVEVSTGPLGQGISNAVGLALAETHLAAVFNTKEHKIVDHYTYVICGDGCLQEGVSSEAGSLAGHLGLGKLIVCYDDNGITIDGETHLSFTEDVNKRYEAYNWHVQTVTDVNDLVALRHAIEEAKRVTDKPSIIKIRTIIGHGSAKQGTEAVHGAPLGAADVANVKTKFGFDPTQSFVVPPEVHDFYHGKVLEGTLKEQAWLELFKAYAKANPQLAEQYTRQMNGQLPADWKAKLPKYHLPEPKAAATRNRSEEVLNALANYLPELIGGSADLTPSNLTSLKCSSDYQKETPAGRYIRFGVREHGMAAICNGIMAHGGLRPYCATFLNFIGYALGAVRLSALSHFGIIYVMTHDSIGLGEDGPTHQPIETLPMLRAMPNLFTMRPADGNETSGAYAIAMQHARTPTVICLSRQAVPTLEGTCAEKVAHGGYTLADLRDAAATASTTYPHLTIIGTGTEVQLALATARQLTTTHKNWWVRVVSMPCTELFDAQSHEYQKSVLVPGSPVMSVEAAETYGWKKYAHAAFGIENSFGFSAPGDKIYKHFGFTVENLSAKGEEVVRFYGGHNNDAPKAPHMLDFPHISMKAVHDHHNK